MCIISIHLPILSDFFVKSTFFSYNERMNRKYRIWGICLGVLVLILLITPRIHRHVRLEESQIIPKVTTTSQILPVPDGNIKKMLADRTSTTLIVLNARNTKLNQKFDQFINKYPDMNLTKPIYIFQELYHNQFIKSLKLDQSVISVVQFDGETQKSVYQITSTTDFNQELLNQLKEFSTK